MNLEILEKYRSGHNEPHSKCGCLQRHVGSNPTFSATNNNALNFVEHCCVSSSVFM